MAAKTWTAKELSTLKKLWGKKTTKEIAQVLERTPDSVGAKGRELKLGPTKLPPNSPLAKPVAKKPAPKPAPKVAPKPAPKAVVRRAMLESVPADTGTPLRGIKWDKAMSKIVTPEADLAHAFDLMQEAVETLLEALKNQPLSKNRATLALHAFNTLDFLEKMKR